jgi:hypothetical protein
MGAGAIPKGMVTMGFPGPIPEGCRRVIKGCSEMRGGVAEQKIFRDGKICGGARRRLIRRRRVSNGLTQPVLRHEKSRERMGAVGNDTASSAQSKRGGARIEHSSVGLGGGSTIDGGRKTTVAGGSDVLAVVEGAEGVETACLRSSWGEVGGW